jgi:hypothetical protein
MSVKEDYMPTKINKHSARATFTTDGNCSRFYAVAWTKYGRKASPFQMVVFSATT